jgi:hypothetical protein
VPVAYTSNRGSNPAQANSSKEPVLKNPSQRADGVAQGVGPELEPQYWKKKILFYFLNEHHGPFIF